VAEREAQELRSGAQSDYQRVVEEGRRQGMAEGQVQVADLVNNARNLRQKVLQEVEPRMIDMAIDMAKAIVSYEVEHRPSTAVDIVANILNYFLSEAHPIEEMSIRKGERRIITTLHPDDLKNLERAGVRLKERLRYNVPIEFKPDEAIGRGGCIVQMDSHTLDARVETQLQEIVRILLGKAPPPDDKADS
jgi:flagellar assembly protein FliH